MEVLPDVYRRSGPVRGGSGRRSGAARIDRKRKVIFGKRRRKPPRGGAVGDAQGPGTGGGGGGHPDDRLTGGPVGGMRRLEARRGRAAGAAERWTETEKQQPDDGSAQPETEHADDGEMVEPHWTTLIDATRRCRAEVDSCKSIIDNLTALYIIVRLRFANRYLTSLGKIQQLYLL